MRLASYNMRGRPSFGAVVGEGIVDLRSRLSRFATLVDVFRAPGAGRGESRRRPACAPTCRSAEVELLAAALGAGKNPLHRHQLRQSRPGL